MEDEPKFHKCLEMRDETGETGTRSSEGMGILPAPPVRVFAEKSSLLMAVITAAQMLSTREKPN